MSATQEMANMLSQMIMHKKGLKSKESTAAKDREAAMSRVLKGNEHNRANTALSYMKYNQHRQDILEKAQAQMAEAEYKEKHTLARGRGNHAAAGYKLHLHGKRNPAGGLGSFIKQDSRKTGAITGRTVEKAPIRRKYSDSEVRSWRRNNKSQWYKTRRDIYDAIQKGQPLSPRHRLMYEWMEREKASKKGKGSKR